MYSELTTVIELVEITVVTLYREVFRTAYIKKRARTSHPEASGHAN